MIKRGKKGQFYIIAAVIIAVVIAGLATTINYAITSETPTRFYDLSKSYNLEAAKVVDYGVYQKYTPPVPIEDILQNFTDQFYANAQLKDPNIEVILVYGNSSSATAFSYTKNETTFLNAQNTATFAGGESVSQTNLYVSDKPLGLQNTLQKMRRASLTNPGKLVRVIISNETNQYQIPLEEGQSFYFIIKSAKPSGEVNVATG